MKNRIGTLLLKKSFLYYILVIYFSFQKKSFFTLLNKGSIDI